MYVYSITLYSFVGYGLHESLIEEGHEPCGNTLLIFAKFDLLISEMDFPGVQKTDSRLSI